MDARTPLPDPLPAPDASSRTRDWKGVVVDVHRWPGGGSVVSPGVDHDFVAMRMSGVVRLVQHRDGAIHRDTVGPGNVTLHPRGLQSSWSWDGPGDIVIARIPPAVLVAASEEGGGPAAVGLRNCFGGRDLFIERILLLLASELDRPPHPAQALISDSLSCALACHLVHRFNVPVIPPRRRRLPAPSLRRVLSFIEDNPGERLTLGQLAELAGVSRFHFARLFRETTGLSVMAHVEQVRLRRAQLLLRTTEHSVSEVALMLGFADQSHFTRRFRRFTGCTPSAFARAMGRDGV